MGFERGFLDYERIEPAHRPVAERVHDFNEYIATLSAEEARLQAGRCMDCGTPFCMHKCPLHNAMPDFNQFVSDGEYEKAIRVLESSNNFPEITGRICPALCEEACTLGLHRVQVGIKSVERRIAEYAFEHGFIKPSPCKERSFRKVAIVGSGPAALSCAQQLTRLGHQVTVFEKNDLAGGLLRYGIPDFKLSKEVLDRRLTQLELEGVIFRTSVLVGDKDKLEQGVHCQATCSVSAQELLDSFDAVVLAPGSEAPRDLKLPGRELAGIYFALDFLIAQNREINGSERNPIDVKGKQVVIIGGGETASDCIGVALRKGAAKVTQLDYHHELPLSVPLAQIWPEWRPIKRTSTSQEEGCIRLFSTNTTAFLGSDGKVEKVKTVQVKWGEGRNFEALAGTEAELEAQVVLIAMGYSHPSRALIEAFSLQTDERGNIKAPLTGSQAYHTSQPKVFAAGDGRKGQSLVVHAIAEGRGCSKAVHEFLSSLPAR